MQQMRQRQRDGKATSIKGSGAEAQRLAARVARRNIAYRGRDEHGQLMSDIPYDHTTHQSQISARRVLA
jgi:hypothetical protein